MDEDGMFGLLGQEGLVGSCFADREIGENDGSVIRLRFLSSWSCYPTSFTVCPENSTDFIQVLTK